MDSLHFTFHFSLLFTHNQKRRRSIAGTNHQLQPTPITSHSLSTSPFPTRARVKITEERDGLRDQLLKKTYRSQSQKSHLLSSCALYFTWRHRGTNQYWRYYKTGHSHPHPRPTRVYFLRFSMLPYKQQFLSFFFKCTLKKGRLFLFSREFCS